MAITILDQNDKQELQDQINELSDVFESPKNLFDPDTITDGKYVNQANGAFGTNANHVASALIPVVGGGVYVASYNGSKQGGTDFRYACYDADEVFISGGTGSSSNPITVPANAVYIRYSFDKSKFVNNQFELGSTPTEYVPYGAATQIKPEYIPKDKELAAEVENLGERVAEVEKNAGGGNGADILPITPENTTFFVKPKNLFIVDDVEVGKLLNLSTGVAGSSSSYITTGFIPVVSGENYAPSYNGKKHSGTFRMVAYAADKSTVVGSFNSAQVYFTMPENAAYVRYSFYNTQFSENQFEKGTAPTEYEVGGAYIDPAYIRLGAGEFMLNLPSKLYGLVGEELNIYFDNLVDGHDTDYQFDATCPDPDNPTSLEHSMGMQLERCFRFVPTTAGEYPITIKATSKDGATVEKSATIYVADTTAGNGDTTSVIVLGDSTTDNGTAITKLNQNMSGDVMGVTTLGTRGTTPNNHEGRSGWRFDMYFNTASTSGVGVNPFYNPDTQTFDAAYYFANSGVAVPEWFFINLGINDVFNGVDDSGAVLRITTAANYCDSVIASLKSYAPNIKIGVVLTIPPNYSQDAFGKKYGSRQTRNRYKRNNVMWVQEQISRYDGREDENIYLVPIYTNLDTKYNMTSEETAVNKRNPDVKYNSPIGSGGVHPATEGYWQIADVYWFFLKNNA